MNSTTSLSKASRTAAIAALVLSASTWFSTGAHAGWTQTSVVKMQHDEITGIDYPVRQPAFILGLEALFTGVAVAGVFAGLSFIPRRRAVRV